MRRWLVPAALIVGSSCFTAAPRRASGAFDGLVALDTNDEFIMGRGRGQKWQPSEFRGMRSTRLVKLTDREGKTLKNMYEGNGKWYVFRQFLGEKLEFVRRIDGKRGPSNKVLVMGAALSAANVEHFAQEMIDDFNARTAHMGNSAREMEAAMVKASGIEVPTSAAEVQLLDDLEVEHEVKIKEDLAHLTKLCEGLAKDLAKMYPGLPVNALHPPSEDRAMALCLNSYPDCVTEIRKEFKAKGRDARAGKMKDFARAWLKEHGKLVEMLEEAYPVLQKFPGAAEEITKKTKEHACWAHLDHCLAALPDELFHFVLMLGPSNTSFGYANKHGAKAIYVGAGKHVEFQETANVFLGGI